MTGYWRWLVKRLREVIHSETLIAIVMVMGIILEAVVIIISLGSLFVGDINTLLTSTILAVSGFLILTYITYLCSGDI